MKRFLLIFNLLFVICLGCKGQVIECSPEFPTAASTDIVITFHADNGTAGLKGYSGDIYAHTGVIYKGSSDWNEVVADWDKNDAKCKLTKLSTNTYTLNIGSIANFYGITEEKAKNVEKLVFVFRSSDGTKEGKDEGGKDIFQSIYDKTLNVNLTSLSNSYVFVDGADGETIPIKASVSEEALFKLSCDGNLKNKTTEKSKSYSYDLETEKSGSHEVELKAETDTETASTSFTYIIHQESPTATMTANLKRGVNANSSKSATFVLYAPNKKSAYVTGSFNNWQINNDCLMNKSSDGNYFFKTIDNLDPNTEYIYQYLVDENIRIADPYTEKISDPYNDKYISNSVYPNLIAYPEGKTSGIASTFKLNKDSYEFSVKNFDAPKSENLVIYELLIRDFTNSGTVAGVIDSLDYLKNLGINAIEFLPVNEFEGNDSWGYNPSFYFAADKAYGTQNDYKKLVDECHKRGIAVIFDLVLNHSFGQSPFVQLYYDAKNDKVTSESPWYNVSSPNTDYYWGYDFNHESPETQKLVDSVATYWLTEYNVDGFRYDFTKGFTNTKGNGWAYDESRIKILKRIYDHIKSVKSNAYMICEHLTDNREEKELADYGIMLWTNVNYAFCQSTMGYSDGADVKNIYYQSLSFGSPNSVAYAESHDEERMMFKAMKYGNSTITNFENAMRNAAAAGAILLSVPGPKMIWQYGELGYDYSINYDINSNTESESARTGRKPVPNDYMANKNRKAVYDMYALVNNQRKENDAFSGKADLDVSGLVKTVYLTGETNNAIVTANFDVSQQKHTISFPHTGEWYELVGQSKVIINEISNSLILNSGQVRIYTDKEPIYTAVKTVETKNVDLPEINIFPNPATENISITQADKISDVEIWNLNGKCVKKIKNTNSENNILRVDVGNYPSGMYILAIKMGNNLISKKITIVK